MTSKLLLLPLALTTAIWAASNSSTAMADSPPIEMERVVHDQPLLPALQALPSQVEAGVFGQKWLLNSSLDLVAVQDALDSQPVAYLGASYATLGGPAQQIFVGHQPRTSIVVRNGQDSREIRLYESPAIDNHEIEVDRNGNFWFLEYRIEECAQHKLLCGPSKPGSVEKFASCVVKQVTPQGELLFEWAATDHLPVSELRFKDWLKKMPASIYAPQRFGGNPEFADIHHCNSIDVSPSGKEFLVSMRHTDSIYLIERSSGSVIWKIGGNRWPGKSLRVITANDYESGREILSGQHDARFWGPNGISVFDNSTGLERPARGLLFKIDTPRRQVRVAKVLPDPFGYASNCTGSMRSLSQGRFWIVGWGCSPTAATVFEMGGLPIVSLRPRASASNTQFFNAIWPNGLADVLQGQMSYRFTVQGDAAW